MGEIEMTIYIGYELNNELSKLIKKAEEKKADIF